MLAAYHGHADLVKLLLRHGADPNRLNDRGQSPLAGAVFKMEDAVVEVYKTPEQSFLFRSALPPMPRPRLTEKKKSNKALLEGGADPDHGSPTSLQCVVLFKQEEKWRSRFELAPGRGKAATNSS